MKCPRCSAWSDVLETRTRQDNTKRRRYECANGHRFSTVELISEELPSEQKRSKPDRPNKNPED